MSSPMKPLLPLAVGGGVGGGGEAGAPCAGP